MKFSTTVRKLIQKPTEKLFDMRYVTLFIILLVGSWSSVSVAKPNADSVAVVKLLAEGRAAMAKGKQNLMLFYGHKLQGVPYVAHTLEVNPKERLVVNLRELDCTTFVESVLALCLTTREGSVKYSDYCRNLTRIRYEGGKMDGYPSRNHYFYWWAESNRKLGIVSYPIDQDAKKASFVARQRIDVNWMTTHVSSYKMLKGDAKAIKAIGEHEKSTKGKTMYYIPQASLGLSKKEMRYVENGDILAIVTKKKGLDTVHIGIAEWGSDGKLHLLNASQIHKKVILEPMSLHKYMSKHPVQIGVWVLRPLL